MNLVKESDLANSVQFLGRLAKKEKRQWYDSCDAFINLSTIEAFGITILEGLASGKPVIIGNAGSFLELQKEFPSQMFNFKDSLGFFDSVVKKYKPLQLKTLSKYDWTGVAISTEQLYQKVLNE
jgi:glycosyltransferase involved in cell wall biosynthesis